MAIYFDNGSTSFPKPKDVANKVHDFLIGSAVNINRGIYKQAHDISDMVYETRLLLKKLFNAEDEKNVAFSSGVTESLNLILHGFLRKGDHIIISPLEHNAVYRVVKHMQIDYDLIPFQNGIISIESIRNLIKKNTRAIITTHGSNVSGEVLDIVEIGAVAREAGIAFIVDCAQTAGILPIDMQEANIDALGFTGHKSMLGPQGIGGLVLAESFIHKIKPIKQGGTGSISDNAYMPEFMPDKFEAGTLNLPGIAGLNAALKYINEQTMSSIYEKEMAIHNDFYAKVSDIKGIEVLEVKGQKTPLISITSEHDIAIIAFELFEKFGVMTRVGMHCSPLAHKSLGTFPMGTLRFSFGHANTIEQVNLAIKALEEILWNLGN